MLSEICSTPQFYTTIYAKISRTVQNGIMGAQPTHPHPHHKKGGKLKTGIGVSEFDLALNGDILENKRTKEKPD